MIVEMGEGEKSPTNESCRDGQRDAVLYSLAEVNK
jgi:hypothetical protein